MLRFQKIKSKPKTKKLIKMERSCSDLYPGASTLWHTLLSCPLLVSLSICSEVLLLSRHCNESKTCGTGAIQPQTAQPVPKPKMLFWGFLFLLMKLKMQMTSQWLRYYDTNTPNLTFSDFVCPVLNKHSVSRGVLFAWPFLFRMSSTIVKSVEFLKIL